jgi:predicted ATPase
METDALEIPKVTSHLITCVVISGCSGTGKSTLLAELSQRGYAVVEEPGRRVAREEMEHGGSALPWLDAAAFLRRALAMALADWTSAGGRHAWVFFDRGLIDAAAGLQHLTGELILEPLAQNFRYHRRVFLAPPWPEIYQQDPERRHGLESALAEYSRLLEVCPSLGYEVFLLPKATVAERADFVLKTLNE